jgi:2,3-bisphosphoglycerate-dependent phosphoglycerate mutase
MAYLVLIRHGESTWNALGLWTGYKDVPLTSKGHAQARNAAQLIKDITLDIAYTSVLKRAQQTLTDILHELNSANIKIIKHQALNERDYGDLTGKNKWKIKEEYGEEQFLKWRRGWDYPPPNGESLKDVYNRVVPYYKNEILPKLNEGKNVIIVAHGNSLRALVKYLENISDEDIAKLEIGLGEVYVYTIENGEITSKEIRVTNRNTQ